MEITRRHLAAAGALALGTLSLSQSPSSAAESADQVAVDKAVEALRKALLEKNKAGLEQLTADQLSYGHSSGKVQSKAEFVDGVMMSKAVTKSIAFPELTVAVVGDTAIARHLSESEMETDRPAEIASTVAAAIAIVGTVRTKTLVMLVPSRIFEVCAAQADNTANWSPP